MYDFANSSYTTVVITAVFSAYFVGAVAQKAAWGPLAWTLTLSLSYALVMLTSAALGAWADRHGAKKRALAVTTLGCVLCTAALATVGAGDLWWAVALVFLSNTFFAWGESLIAAFLPQLARPEAIGKVSGWGWAWGYVGGMLALGMSLAYVLWAQSQGLPATQFVPVTMGITAVFYAMAALVTLMWLRERPAAAVGPLVNGQSGLGIGSGGVSWRQTWATMRGYPDFVWLMASTTLYQGGVAVAITLAAIYAEQVIGFVPQETMALIFVLNIAAAIGAWTLGHAQDRWGHQRVLGWTLWAWALTCVLAALTTSKAGFWWAAALAGLCMGASQSSGRALAGLLAPPERLGEFFGFWALATRLASILGPLTYGLVTWLTGGNQRLAIGLTACLFVAGWAVLQRLDVQRGRQRALEPSGESAALVKP